MKPDPPVSPGAIVEPPEPEWKAVRNYNFSGSEDCPWIVMRPSRSPMDANVFASRMKEENARWLADTLNSAALVARAETGEPEHEAHVCPTFGECYCEYPERHGDRVDRLRTSSVGAEESAAGAIHIYDREPPTWLCAVCREQWQAAHNTYLVATTDASAVGERDARLEQLIRALPGLRESDGYDGDLISRDDVLAALRGETS